jgi:hypothetical protein
MRGSAGQNFCGSRIGDAETGVAVEVFFCAGGAIPFAGVFIALTGKFITAADAIAITGPRSSLYGYERHGVSLRKR